jgi:hypothetical protein
VKSAYWKESLAPSIILRQIFYNGLDRYTATSEPLRLLRFRTVSTVVLDRLRALDTEAPCVLTVEHGRGPGFEWHQGQRQGTETPPPGRRGSDSPGQHVYDQYPLTPGLSGPPSRRSTDESNYASPPNASDYSGSYFSASSARLPLSPVAGQLGGLTAAMSLSRESGGRRDSSAAAHPYLRRPSLGESVAGQTIPSMSWGYSRARSPLGFSPTGAEPSRIENNDSGGVDYEGVGDRDQG